MKTREVKLGEVANVKGGKRIPKGIGLINIPNGHPYIRVRDLNNKRLLELDNSYEYVDNETQKVISKYTVKTGDVVLSIVGTIGLVAIVGRTLDGANLTENCVKLSSFHGVNRDFLYYYLRSDCGQQEIRCGTVGAVQAKLPIKNIQNIAINLPDYTTQERIASLLLSIDRKIELNQKINDNLEQQAKLIYDYWFTQFDFPDENGKPYCSSGGKMVWDEQLKRNIPENWNVVPLLKLVSWESNSQPPKSEFVYEPKEGYVRFIQNRDYDSDTHITYIPRTKNLSIVDRFDILMDKYGDAGAVRYGIEGAFNVALGKICVHNPNYREYIRSFLGSDGIYKFLHNSCMASTRASLSEANLAILNVVVPDEKIILDYENFLQKIRVSILKNKDETVELINLRDWLLPMLMNGQATIAD